MEDPAPLVIAVAAHRLEPRVVRAIDLQQQLLTFTAVPVEEVDDARRGLARLRIVAKADVHGVVAGLRRIRRGDEESGMTVVVAANPELITDEERRGECVISAGSGRKRDYLRDRTGPNGRQLRSSCAHDALGQDRSD